MIKSDIQLIKWNKIIVLTFWTFDILHPWHEYYLNTAKTYWNYLVTIIWTDNNVEKIKWRKPILNQETRKNNLKHLNIADIVEIWDENYPLKCLDIYKPKVICLWYDQEWFSAKLNEFPNIQIIRLKPYKENQYKSSLMKY